MTKLQWFNNKIKGKEVLDTQGRESTHTRNTGQQQYDKIAVVQILVPQDASRANKETNLEDPVKSNSLKGTVSGIIPLQTSKKGSKHAMVLACWFPFWCLAAKGLKVNIQWIVLKDLKWQHVIRKVCPGIQIMQISEVGQTFKTPLSVDIILVNACSLQDVALIQEKITSKTVLFDSRIRARV